MLDYVHLLTTTPTAAAAATLHLCRQFLFDSSRLVQLLGPFIF
jgi:hypothetical protein